MERYLTLVRHAKSSWKEDGALDFDRSLSARGERDLERIAELFAGLPTPPGVLLASPARRARLTVGGIVHTFPSWSGCVRYEECLYDADIPDVLSAVGEVPGSVCHVMVVGHNPTLADLASALLPRPLGRLPTLGVVCIESEAVTWDTLQAAPARLRAFAYPKGLT